MQSLSLKQTSTGRRHQHPDESNGIWGSQFSEEAFAVKMAFYLDPVTRDTGALQLIPGASPSSHSVSLPPPRCRRFPVSHNLHGASASIVGI